MRERKRPKQASLHRAVSAAYYAVFHLLVADGSRLLSPANPRGLRMLVGRAFDHGQMRNVCKAFIEGNAGPPGNRRIPQATQTLLTLPLEQDLVRVLDAFVGLQEARHQADYDLGRNWNRLDALNQVQTAQDAFRSWAIVHAAPNAAVFAAALLLQRHWAR